MTWWREGTGMWRKILQLRESVERHCVSLSMCVSVMCTVTLHNSSSFLGHRTAWASHIELILISRNAITSVHTTASNAHFRGGGVGKGISSVIDVCTQLTVAVETASGYRGD